MELKARKDLAAGQAATLDYGRRPLRDVIRGYGFVPQAASRTCAFEVRASHHLPRSLRGGRLCIVGGVAKTESLLEKRLMANCD